MFRLPRHNSNRKLSGKERSALRSALIEPGAEILFKRGGMTRKQAYQEAAARVRANDTRINSAIQPHAMPILPREFRRRTSPSRPEVVIPSRDRSVERATDRPILAQPKIIVRDAKVLMPRTYAKIKQYPETHGEQVPTPLLTRPDKPETTGPER